VAFAYVSWVGMALSADWRRPNALASSIRSTSDGCQQPPSGGRSWWAHFDFTRINIEPIILKNKFEDVREFGALVGIGAGADDWVPPPRPTRLAVRRLGSP